MQSFAWPSFRLTVLTFCPQKRDTQVKLRGISMREQHSYYSLIFLHIIWLRAKIFFSYAFHRHFWLTRQFHCVKSCFNLKIWPSLSIPPPPQHSPSTLLYLWICSALRTLPPPPPPTLDPPPRRLITHATHPPNACNPKPKLVTKAIRSPVVWALTQCKSVMWLYLRILPSKTSKVVPKNAFYGKRTG